ncbi:UNVERIFIED_CONTAM: hypothetical protein NCL1_20332 [Trichonephila clavipes]
MKRDLLHTQTAYFAIRFSASLSSFRALDAEDLQGPLALADQMSGLSELFQAPGYQPQAPNGYTGTAERQEELAYNLEVTLAVTGVSSFFIIKKKVVKQRTESMKSRQRMAEARLSKAV